MYKPTIVTPICLTITIIDDSLIPLFFILKPHYIYRYTLRYIQTINTPLIQLYTTIECHINHTLPFFIITQPADTKHWASAASALGVAAQMLVQCRDKSVFSDCDVNVFSAVFC